MVSRDCKLEKRRKPCAADAKKEARTSRLWRWLCRGLFAAMAVHGAWRFVDHLQHPSYSAPAWTAWLVMLYYLPALAAAWWLARRVKQ